MLQFIKDGQLTNFDGILYMFDLSDPQSLNNLEQLHYEIKNKYEEDFISILAGNKSDLISPRSVKSIDNQSNSKNIQSQTDYQADAFAKKNKMLYLKISAK